MLKKKTKEDSENIQTQEKKEETKTWVVGQIATKTEPIFYNNETKEQLDLHDMICLLKNDIEEIKEFLQE